jgi:hypothetical protein
MGNGKAEIRKYEDGRGEETRKRLEREAES